MRFDEFKKIIVTESAQEQEAKELIFKTSDANALKKVVTFLKNKLNVIKPKQDPEQPQNLNQPQEPETGEEQTPIKEDISADKEFAMNAIQELVAAGEVQEVQALISFLRKNEIVELTRRAINTNISQGVKDDLDKKIAQIIIDHPAPFEEKEVFLDKLSDGEGLWDGNDLIKNLSGNIYQKLATDPIASALAKTFALKLRGALGYGPDQGPGEFLLALTGKGIDLAEKSDLVLIAGHGVEVKADGTKLDKKGAKKRSGGRLYATSGYNGGTGARGIVKQALLDAGIPEKELEPYGWNLKGKKKKGETYENLNFNAGGIANLNKLIEFYKLDEDKVKLILKGIIKGFFTDLPEGLDEHFIENSVVNGKIDYKTAIAEWVALGHDYYRYSEGHDYIMIFNTENGDYVCIRDGRDMKEAVDSGKIKIQGGMDYFDDRSKGTPQLLTGNL